MEQEDVPYFPLGQSIMQLPEGGVVEVYPDGQTVQAVAADRLYRPCVKRTTMSEEGDTDHEQQKPRNAEQLHHTAGHVMPEHNPEDGQYLPAEHGSGLLTPSPQYTPAGHV